MALEIKASDIRDLEDFAADMADQQDAGYHAATKKEPIILNDYKRYWINDTAQGHLIKICYGPNDEVMTIDCRWKNRKRDKTNRVNNVKIRNY